MFTVAPPNYLQVDYTKGFVNHLFCIKVLLFEHEHFFRPKQHFQAKSTVFLPEILKIQYMWEVMPWQQQQHNNHSHHHQTTPTMA
jgi:hypothetical protein